jgi:hypothetical protein
MHKFTVGIDMRNLTEERWRIANTEVKEEVKKLLGTESNRLVGSSPYLLAEHEGKFYQSYDNGVYAALDKSEVRCYCGNNTFRVGYGSYECFGTCAACGRKYILYDS